MGKQAAASIYRSKRPARRVQGAGLGFAIAIGMFGVSGASTLLAGTEWRAVEIARQAAPATSQPTLRFGPGNAVAGSSGCNSFSGNYSIEGERIGIGLLTATGMACVGPAMQVEEGFYAALERVVRYARDGNDLLLLDRESAVVLRLTAAAR